MFQHFTIAEQQQYILIVYYNFMNMTVSPRIRTQGDNIPVKHTNYSPKSLR